MHDFTNLRQKALLEAMELERQELLAAGMSEADIFRLHFGEFDEDGNPVKPKDGGYPGDYSAWLGERKHTRSDHKYAPGSPVSIDEVDPNGEWISDRSGGLDDVEFQADSERAMQSLTELERRYFVEVGFHGFTNSEIARRDSKDESAVRRTVERARKKLKNFFE